MLSQTSSIKSEISHQLLLLLSWRRQLSRPIGSALLDSPLPFFLPQQHRGYRRRFSSHGSQQSYRHRHLSDMVMGKASEWKGEREVMDTWTVRPRKVQEVETDTDMRARVTREKSERQA